jgi:hypothetical protein
VTLPAPVPLPPPPESPDALADVIGSVTGAAVTTGMLAASLAGPATAAPGWLGADAAEAARQIAAVAALAGGLHDGLATAVDRLAAHCVVLNDAVRTVRSLQGAQADDFADAGAQLRSLYAETGGRGDPLSVLDELAAAEAARCRAHDALLLEIADDAAATAGVLAGASVGLGGSGAPGDDVRVLAHLAGLLPGWGDAELAALGRAAAADLAGASPAEVAAALQGDDPLLDSPPFAGAFFAALGAQGFAVLLQEAALAERPGDVAGPLARLVAAGQSGTGQGARVEAVLAAPLLAGMEATTAVGLGRLAAAGGLPAAYLARIVEGLAVFERDPWPVRRDELLVAAAEDPLDAAMAALAATGDARAATGVLADPSLWPGLLGREWTNGFEAIGSLLRLAAATDAGADAVVGTALRAIGDSVDVLVTSVTTGSPEAFTVAGLSPVLAELVADHLPVVTDVVTGSLGLPGSPSRPLDEPGRRLLEGLAMVTLDPGARLTVLAGLTAATSAAPLTGPGDEIPAAYAEGGVFAAMAFGESQAIRHHLYSAVARAEGNDLAWTVVTLPLGGLPVRRGWEWIRDAVSTGTSFVNLPGTDVAWEDFLAQPKTGADQAAFAVIAAGARPLADAGVLPDPGSALGSGLGSPEAREYEARLGDGPIVVGGPVEIDGQRVVYHRLRDNARAGYLDVGTALGLLPGS